MNKGPFFMFNLLSFLVFIIIFTNSVAQLTGSSQFKDEFWYILIAFSLLGMLIQFYFINKRLSE